MNLFDRVFHLQKKKYFGSTPTFTGENDNQKFYSSK